MVLPFPEGRKATVLNVVVARPDIFRPKFLDWLDENFHIWSRFEFEAHRVWDAGRQHYSASTIVEYLRHDTLVRDKSSEFKINAAWTSSLARLYVMLYPLRTGLFEFRERYNAVVKLPPQLQMGGRA